MVRIAVVGAGVIGLSTALNIQQRIPNVKVKIIADRFLADTTSDGAGGLFRPTTKMIEGVKEDVLRKWCEDSFTFFNSLAMSSEAGASGAMLMTGYILSYTPIKNPLYKKIVYSFKELTRKEVKKISNEYPYGYQVTTAIVEPRKYLPWLMSRIKKSGGEFETRTVENLFELAGEYDIVVNCTGLRSRELVGDTKLYPVRGQLVKVKAPWIKNWFFTDENIYFLPRGSETVFLGGQRQRGREDISEDPVDTKDILDKCQKHWPSLKGAEVEGVWTGLRPHRNPPRIEAEIMNSPEGNLKVVHNYGHGANGISLSWGTSVEAARLVATLLRDSKL